MTNNEKIIDKIKCLLNQTVANGCTEEEAKTAFAMARKLMIKYKISENKIKTNNEDDILEKSYIKTQKYVFLLTFTNSYGKINL